MKIYYHNVTKQILNQTDITDLMDSYAEGDVLYKSEAGCALLEEVTKDEIENLRTDVYENRN